MDIGTAKPTKGELEGVPHYFLDFIEPEIEYTAGMFERDGLEKIEELLTQDDYVIMVGGSTLYIDAITKGFDDLPKDLDVRNQLIKETEELGLQVLLNELKAKDLAYYNEVDQSNSVRVQRALEVIRISGEKYSDLRVGKEKLRNFKMIKIALNDDREVLYDRINARVDQMMYDGLEEEARKLFPRKGLTSLKTVGYQELFEYFENKISKEEAVELIKRNSRRYAKRQLTWFRRDPEAEWFEPGEFEQVLAFIKKRN